MRFEERFSPVQLGSMALGATALLYAGLPFARLLSHYVFHGRCTEAIFIVRVLLLASPYIACLAMTLTATSAIKRGVRLDVWSEAQLQPLRTAVSSRWFKTLPMFVLAMVLLGYLLSLISHQGRGSFPWTAWYVFFFPLQMLNEVRRSLLPPVKASGISWRHPLPLQSEHWGEGRSA